MTKECCICGCEFTPRMKTQITCGDPDCKRIRHLEYMSEYGYRNRAKHREYNREWMRRARQVRGDDLPKDGSADNYAERQKQKTLAMVGGVDLERGL